MRPGRPRHFSKRVRIKIRWISSTTPPPEDPDRQPDQEIPRLLEERGDRRAARGRLGNQRVHHRVERDIQSDEHREADDQSHAEVHRPFLAADPQRVESLTLQTEQQENSGEDDELGAHDAQHQVRKLRGQGRTRALRDDLVDPGQDDHAQGYAQGGSLRQGHRVLRSGSDKRPAALCANTAGQPYVWTKTADDILASVARFALRTVTVHDQQQVMLRTTGTGH